MVDRAYSECSVRAYLEKLASADPEPGGGSAAALAGALGAALVMMVTALTLGKERYAAVQTDMAEIKEKAEKLGASLTAFVTEDAEAYGAVAAAIKLPGDSSIQSRERNRVLQAALKGAAEVPLKIAEAAVEVARLSLPAAEKGNNNAVSDAGVAVLMAESAAQSAALNVKINLAWIEDDAFKKEAWARVEAALSETGRLRDVVLTLTYSKI
jgi:methenyltetrahydrofolate cyclohydrolase